MLAVPTGLSHPPPSPGRSNLACWREVGLCSVAAMGALARELAQIRHVRAAMPGACRHADGPAVHVQGTSQQLA